MISLKKIFIIFFCFPTLSYAEYFFGYGTGAYLGRHQLQGEWVSENTKHHVLGILGYTKDERISEIKQLSTAYLWSLDTKQFENFKWTPILIGGFLTYTNHKKFYFKSPSKYRDETYYDITNLRFGFRFGTEVSLIRKSGKSIKLLLDSGLAEQALLIFFNNPSEIEIFKSFWSLGLSVRLDY